MFISSQSINPTYIFLRRILYVKTKNMSLKQVLSQAVIAVFLTVNLSVDAHAQEKIWFDTDQLMGNPERAPREVDDAIALIMALKFHKDIQIEGISLVTDVDYGY